MAGAKDELVDEGAMQTMSVAPPGESTPPQTLGEKRDHQEQQLDEALDQSMDASDPPSTTQPGRNDESEAHPS